MLNYLRISVFFILFSLSTVVSALDATYYSDAFEGSYTSNGSVFTQSGFSAAACNMNLGDYVFAQYENTGVVVTLNDKPNCTRYPDLIDFSRSAFGVFAPTSVGRISGVTTTSIGKNENNFVKQNFATTLFSDLGVLFAREISNTYFAGDTIVIKGKVTIKKDVVFIFVRNKTTKEEVVSDLVKVDKGGYFTYYLQFPEQPGEYEFVMAGGNSFQITEIPVIKLISRDDFVYPELPKIQSTIKPSVKTMGDDKSFLSIPENTWGLLSIFQDGKRYISQGNGVISLNLMPGLSSGQAEVVMTGYALSTPSSLDRSREFFQSYSGRVTLDRLRESIGREKLSIKATRQNATLRFRLKSTDKIRSAYYVTLPNGDVRQYEFAKNYIDTNGYLKTGVWINAAFPFRDAGSYKVELVDATGFAYVNIPLYQGTVWPVLPTITNTEKLTIRKQQSTVERDAIAAINKIRAGLGRNLIVADPVLTTIAQAKAEDMILTDVSHTNSKGKDIRSLIKALGIQFNNFIYENVAGGTVSDLFLQDGLEESGSHRSAMIAPEVTRVGIGYAVKDGKTYMAQEFSGD